MNVQVVNTYLTSKLSRSLTSNVKGTLGFEAVKMSTRRFFLRTRVSFFILGNGQSVQATSLNSKLRMIGNNNNIL